MSVKQYIVLRKDPPTHTGEPVSAAKLATMAAHASSAFLLRHIVSSAKLCLRDVQFALDHELEEWVLDNYVKVLLGAKTKDFLKLPEKASALGFRENIDFFRVHDICRTELLPDDGADTCFIAIGFRPMDEDKIRPLVKRLQLY